MTQPQPLHRSRATHQTQPHRSCKTPCQHGYHQQQWCCPMDRSRTQTPPGMSPDSKGSNNTSTGAAAHVSCQQVKLVALQKLPPTRHGRRACPQPPQMKGPSLIADGCSNCCKFPQAKKPQTSSLRNATQVQLCCPVHHQQADPLPGKPNQPYIRAGATGIPCVD